MTRYPGKDGLPLWLFILVIFLSFLTLALMVFIVWRKCSKRPKRQISMSSSDSDSPARKVSVRKGQLVRASWNVSLTGPRFGAGAGPSPEQNRKCSRQWPQSPTKEPSSHQIESFEEFQQNNSGVKNEAAGFLSRPWSGISRKQTGSIRRSLSTSRNRRSFRPSYISESAITESEIHDKMPETPATIVQPKSWLESPRPFSPIAPLTLPHMSDSPPPTFLKSPDSLAPPKVIPSKPSRTYQINHQDECLSPRTRRHQRESSRLDPGWPIPQDLEAQQYRSSTASNRSFLQEWSSVYYRWLAGSPAPPAARDRDHNPNRESIRPDSTAFNFSRRIDSRPTTMIRPKTMEDDVVSLPSLSPMTSDDPPSPLSTTFSEKYQPRWNGAENTSSGVNRSRGGQGNLSWLNGR